MISNVNLKSSINNVSALKTAVPQQVSAVRKKDTFIKNPTNEMVFGDALKSAMGEYESSQSAREAITEAMDTDVYANFPLIGGMKSDRIADRAGNIGKAIDKLHSDGTITDDDYAALNKSLEEYTEKLASKSERERASLAAIRENHALRMFNAGISSKEYMENVRHTKESFIQSGKFAIDRTALLEMILKIRNS